MDNVKLTIDGVDVEVPKGTLVIRAAEQAGIYIPRFCDHPLLDPLGACRQCLVEVEGQRKPLTACTTTVADGMVVMTQWTSDVAREAQDGQLEFLLINHPLDCPMCDKGGECPLQDQTLAYGPGGSRFIEPKRRYVKPVPISPLVKLDRERCVLCARCTRFSQQIAGDPFIELFERGALEQVAIFEDEPYESNFSGNVIQICPVGALTSSTFRFRARPFDMSSSPSTCTRCASGCAITVEERRGALTRVLAREDHSSNDEWICDKGRFGFAFVSSNERVVEPMIRKDGDFVAASWAEAIALVGARIREARDAGMPAAVLSGGNLLDEDAYALSRFARSVLRTNDVDARRRAGTAEEDQVLQQVAHARAATYADIDAAQVVVVAGSDPHEESPIVFLRLRKNMRKRGLRVIEVGPRATALHRSGAEWVPCAPGEEADALAALGITGAAVVLAGDRLAASPGALTAAWNLAVSNGGSFGWLPRKAGARGALAAGLHPSLLPGGRSVRWMPQREELQSTWGVEVSDTPGRDAREILEHAAEYGLIVLAGADPARDFADADLGARALDAAGFVVAQDMFVTDSARRADVILPVAAPFERAGTITGWDGVAREVRATIPPAGLAQADWEICAQIAREAGVDFPATLEAIRDEMRGLAPVAGAPEPLEMPDRAQRQPRAGGFALVTYPLLIDDGTMMAGAQALKETARTPFVELNTQDAARLGISDGDDVRLISDAGEVRAPARVTDDVVAGAVFVPARARDVDAAALQRAADALSYVRVEKA